MKLPSIFKTKADQMNAWQWPSCAHAKTLSFRADAGAGIFKTVNSVYLDPAAVDDGVDTPESCFTNTSESASFSTGESDDERIIVTGVRPFGSYKVDVCPHLLIATKTFGRPKEMVTNENKTKDGGRRRGS
nr:transcription repressor OFP13 [Ipomoea batatas]